jgi:hypothetical protein
MASKEVEKAKKELRFHLLGGPLTRVEGEIYNTLVTKIGTTANILTSIHIVTALVFVMGQRGPGVSYAEAKAVVLENLSNALDTFIASDLEFQEFAAKADLDETLNGDKT